MKPTTSPHKARTLVPFGGGKDSFVTAMMLKEQTKDVTLLRVGSHPLIDEAVRAIDLPSIMIERKIAPELIRLNDEGALNGHIPITAIVSWISVVAAILYDFDEIAMSNEKSANIGNAELFGMEVNHQWSKGDEFERMMSTYVKTHISPVIRYSSALRELTEMQIAEKFCSMPQFLPFAVSCNRNWSLTKGPASQRWCGTCPKCAFVFLLYAAFLPKDDVLKVFGKNLFASDELIPTYRELLGMEGIKPFECVGTPEETRAAFALAHTREEWDDSVAMKMYLAS